MIRVFDITNLQEIREVAYFASNSINGPAFAYVIAKTGLRYNYGAVALESNGIGKSSLDFLVNVFEYENIIRLGHKDEDEAGIFSANGIKVQACVYLRDMLECGAINLILRDRGSLLELQKFERTKTKATVTFRASSGNDDSVMALIWGIYGTKEDILELYFNITAFGQGLFGQEIPVCCRPDNFGSLDTEEMFEQTKVDFESEVDEKLKLMSGNKSIEDSVLVNNNGLTTIEKKPEDEDEDDYFTITGNGVNLLDEDW